MDSPGGSSTHGGLRDAPAPSRRCPVRSCSVVWEDPGRRPRGHRPDPAHDRSFAAACHEGKSPRAFSVPRPRQRPGRLRVTPGWRRSACRGRSPGGGGRCPALASGGRSPSGKGSCRNVDSVSKVAVVSAGGRVSSPPGDRSHDRQEGDHAMPTGLRPRRRRHTHTHVFRALSRSNRVPCSPA